jgi:hypothetical protein
MLDRTLASAVIAAVMMITARLWINRLVQVCLDPALIHIDTRMIAIAVLWIAKQPRELSMKRTRMTAVLFATLSVCPSANAADINGAWASDASVCAKVFQKANNRLSFAPDSELYGGGLIVEGNRASGTFQKCVIKSMKNDGTNVHVNASCSTGVMSSDLQLTVKVLGENQITLTPGGPVGTEISYVRCSL